MKIHGLVLSAAAALVALLVPSEAGAGMTSPLSSIDTLPRPIELKAGLKPAPIPGLTLKSKDPNYHELFASTGRGYCLVQGENGHRWMDSYGATSRSETEDLDLDRLTEKDGTVTLERTRVHFDPPSATISATGRSQVELKEIARSATGVVVWAYRQDGAVVVLAKNVDRGIESRQMGNEENGIPFVSANGCPFAGARLDARKPEAGAFVQLTGSLPAQGEGKDKVVPHFVVDASLTRVARDPAPMVSVRVHLKD
jgi:hypothetical protein